MASLSGSALVYVLLLASIFFHHLVDCDGSNTFCFLSYSNLFPETIQYCQQRVLRFFSQENNEGFGWFKLMPYSQSTNYISHIPNIATCDLLMLQENYSYI